MNKPNYRRPALHIDKDVRIGIDKYAKVIARAGAVWEAYCKGKGCDVCDFIAQAKLHKAIHSLGMALQYIPIGRKKTNKTLKRK